MAILKAAKTPDEVKSLGVAATRTAYNQLADDYNRIIDRDVLLCPNCGNWLKTESSFYFDKKYATKRFPICKKCIMEMVEQRSKKNDEPNETKESVQRVLQIMDKPYVDSFYEDCVKGALDNAKERNRTSPFATYITAIQSLPNWKGMTWKDSEFGNDQNNQEINENSRVLKNAKKRFGTDYSLADLIFLENEYQDWISRYDCSQKAQEETFQNLSILKLMKRNAIKNKTSTKDIDHSYQQWLDTGNLKPKQNSLDTFSDAQTMGTLIQKYEETRPLPDIDPELEDVDKIGLYIDAFYRGHASKMLGLKNRFSNIYEKVMKKFTVSPPIYDEESDSEILFDKIFGNNEDG